MKRDKSCKGEQSGSWKRRLVAAEVVKNNDNPLDYCDNMGIERRGQVPVCFVIRGDRIRKWNACER